MDIDSPQHKHALEQLAAALPCPFCGEKPHDEFDFIYPINRDRNLWGAHCTNPRCNASILGKSADEAFERWQSRS